MGGYFILLAFMNIVLYLSLQKLQLLELVDELEFLTFDSPNVPVMVIWCSRTLAFKSHLD